jgi:hypothetical protein
MTPWPKPLIIAAWIGSILSGALALLSLDWVTSTADWLGYALVAWLALACLLLLPPLWMKRSKTIAYARVAAGFALFAGAMFMPIKTHAVKLDMPNYPATSK